MHLLRHPRNAALLGLIFVVIGIIYLVVPNVLGVNDVDGDANALGIAAGATMLLALGVAMAIMAYVLAAGTRE
jgi:type III secretory pathway component EscR